MKIRSDFVTNSSSTAFILVKRTSLTREGLRRLMGIEGDSPFAPIADTLADRLNEYGHPIDDRVAQYYDEPNGTEAFLARKMSSEVARKVALAKQEGAEVLMGVLSSDVDDIKAFLCCDSFELENDEYYLNAIQCSW